MESAGSACALVHKGTGAMSRSIVEDVKGPNQGDGVERLGTVLSIGPLVS